MGMLQWPRLGPVVFSTGPHVTDLKRKERKKYITIITMISDNKVVESSRVILLLYSQLTNAVRMSQRHKIESSCFLTIDVL